MNNSIFHFTNSFENLKKILNDKAFKVSYCKEELNYSFGNLNGGISYSYAIPMISFCDIPLTSKTTYGDFGIGMKLSWAIEKEINPVLYVNKNSKISTSIWRILNNNIIDKAITQLMQLIKNREGKITRNNKIEKTDFYNEREWRYIPVIDLLDTDKYPDYIYQCDYESKLKLLGEKPHINEKKYLLGFDLDSIEVIIVENNEQINSVYEIFDSQDKEKLKLKVKSLEQLIENKLKRQSHSLPYN